MSIVPSHELKLNPSRRRGARHLAIVIDGVAITVDTAGQRSEIDRLPPMPENGSCALATIVPVANRWVRSQRTFWIAAAIQQV